MSSRRRGSDRHGERTKFRLWVEDLDSGERAYADTVFNGRDDIEPTPRIHRPQDAACHRSAFAVIIAVNLVLAFKAVRTFPGLEVENSYVASQTFDAERTAQEALGLDAEAGN